MEATASQRAEIQAGLNRLMTGLKVEVSGQASSRYTSDTVQRALARIAGRDDAEALREREFLTGLLVKHGW